MRFSESVAAYTPLPGDRRGGRRTPLEIDVMLQSESTLAPAITVDIADGGVFVCVRDERAHRLVIGEAVELSLSLPRGGKVMALGEVRWLRAAGQGIIPGVGIAFSDMSSIDRAMIARYLSS